MHTSRDCRTAVLNISTKHLSCCVLTEGLLAAISWPQPCRYQAKHSQSILYQHSLQCISNMPPATLLPTALLSRNRQHSQHTACPSMSTTKPGAAAAAAADRPEQKPQPSASTAAAASHTTMPLCCCPPHTHALPPGWGAGRLTHRQAALRCAHSVLSLSTVSLTPLTHTQVMCWVGHTLTNHTHALSD